MITLKFGRTIVDGAGTKTHQFDIDQYENFIPNTTAMIGQQPRVGWIILGPAAGSYSNSQFWDASSAISIITPPGDVIVVQNLVIYNENDEEAPRNISPTEFVRHMYLPDGPTYVNPSRRPRYTGLFPSYPDDIATRDIPLTSLPKPMVARYNLRDSEVFKVDSSGTVEDIANYIGPMAPDTLPTSQQVGHYVYKFQQNISPGAGGQNSEPWSGMFSMQPGRSAPSFLYVCIDGYVVLDPFSYVYPLGPVDNPLYRLYNIMLPTGHYDLGGETMGTGIGQIVHDPTIP